MMKIQTPLSRPNHLTCLPFNPSGLMMVLFAFLLSNGIHARPEPLLWDKLEFEGSKLLINLKAEISRSVISVQQADTELYKPDEYEAKQPSGAFVLKTEIKTEVLGNQSHYTVWQNPDLEALQRTTLYSGFKNWYRNYRFLSDKAYSLKIEPASGEPTKDWLQWSDIQQSVHAYQPSATADSGSTTPIPLSESGAIFDVLAKDIIEKAGDEHTIYVFNKRGNFAVVLRAEDQRTLKANFQQTISGNKSKRKQKIDTLKLRIDAKLLENDRKATDFKFMGYKDSITIYYDPALNLPLRVTGEVDYAGNVEINLKKASFTDSLMIEP